MSLPAPAWSRLEPHAPPLTGRPLARREDERFLTGRGCYVADLDHPGQVHAVVVRSPIAAARLRAVRAQDALRMPGVIAVYAAADFAPWLQPIPLRGGALPGLEHCLQPPMAVERVRYVGEPVAVVLATSRALAEDAADRVELDLDPLPVVADITAALAVHASVHDSAPDNIAARWSAGRGDAAAAFARAAYTRRERFRCHRHSSVPLETRGLSARWDASAHRLTVWGAAKSPHFARDTLARMLGLAREQVDLVELDVGGSFGARGEFYPEDLLIPAAARLCGRPVKWIEDRRENLLAMNHAREMECELEIAAREDGRILALRGRLVADMGAWLRTTGVIAPAKAGSFLPGPYDIPDYTCELLAVLSHRTPTGTYRGPGRYEANFFRERLIDLMASDLGLDPADVRRRNLIRPEDMPWPIGRLVPYEQEASYDGGDYPAVLEHALALLDYPALAPLRGRGDPDGRLHGVGMACFVDSTGAGPAEYARIEVTGPAEILVHTGCSSSGQGHETVFAQVAADALGLPFAAIRVQHGSTTGTTHGHGSYHGRSMVMGGNAVRVAADTLVSQLLDLAARETRLSLERLDYRAGCVHARDDGRVVLSIASLAIRAAGGDPAAARALAAEGRFDNRVCTFEYGAQVAHVLVDPETAEVEIRRLVTVEDCGNPVNPAIVHGQVLGASVQGLSGTLLEEFRHDAEGQLLTGTFADYLIATATEFPGVEAHAVNLAPSTLNPLGVKGVGEGGIEGVGAAVANAVADALRSRIGPLTDLPITPDRLARALRGTRAARG